MIQSILCLRYLTNRKEEWAKEEEMRIKSLPDPDCPPGHVLMDETERTETLEKLKKSNYFQKSHFYVAALHKLFSLLGQDDLIEEFNSLPVSKDTLRVRNKREEIEQQLVKVDEGIRILSKPKVCIKVDQ